MCSSVWRSQRRSEAEAMEKEAKSRGTKTLQGCKLSRKRMLGFQWETLQNKALVNHFPQSYTVKSEFLHRLTHPPQTQTTGRGRGRRKETVNYTKLAFLPWWLWERTGQCFSPRRHNQAEWRCEWVSEWMTVALNTSTLCSEGVKYP